MRSTILNSVRSVRVLFGLSVLFLGAASCASASKNSAENRGIAVDSELPSRVIDAHTHVHFSGRTNDLGFVDSPAEFRKQLSEVNGRGAVAHTATNRNEHRDFKKLGITPCLGLTKDPNPAVAEKAVRDLGYRCFKVYLGYEYQYASHPKYKRIYRIAEKYGVPVVFHTGDTNDSDGHLKYTDPLTIDEVAVEFRKVKFVLAHVGNPWIQSAAEVAYKNSNVYIDVSALLIGDLKTYSSQQLDEYVVKPIRWVWGYVENPTKLMFGTDWPLVRIPDYLHVVKNAVPKEHWDRFFYLNAAEVFGIKETESAEEFIENARRN